MEVCDFTLFQCRILHFEFLILRYTEPDKRERRAIIWKTGRRKNSIAGFVPFLG
jgi:hypothetical protein